MKEASLAAKTKIQIIAGPEHFGAFNHLGLRGSVHRIPAELMRGTSPEVGRDELRAVLQRRVRDVPCTLVSINARWTLNALSAGYSYEISRDGTIKQEPREGVYRTLMEALESFTGLLRTGIMADSHPNYQRTASGQRYISALPAQAGVLDAKGNIRAADVRSDMPLFARR